MPGELLIPKQVMHERFDDETVLVNMDRGHYFSIRGISADIWAALANDVSIGDLPAQFPQVDGTALDRLLNLFAQQGLILREPLPTEQLTPEEWLNGTVLESTVERFTDVEGLLLLDPIHEVDQSGWPLSPA